jgi:hypothetical protein
MALRLRKDVQKASYYVWFLGAQESKELRGNRVLLSTIPRLIDRSKEQEPLKVTLQISHKGLKIIQGSVKHFIPHSAITCSIQTDDIVACILLLYNPATKCPLHVHAYRCDSDTTAQALHEQLQILINRPENQKRFAELETRLGKSTALQQHQQQSQQMSHQSSTKLTSKRFELSPKRFDSSLGSDTGTSRESECSEDHSPTGPLSPALEKQSHLYDSLAAELRAKLNGNGPPLLLPPRDYDTVHRSQGNLASIELRRNTCIVGGDKQNSTKQGVISSRGSSGIGSDLAPSPERQEAQSSSDDDWNNENREPIITLQQSTNAARRISKSKELYVEERLSATRYRDNPPTYIYPKEPQDDIKKFHRSNSREEEKSQESSNSREEEVKPIITKPPPKDKRFSYVLSNEDDFIDNRKYEFNGYNQKPPVYVDEDRKRSSAIIRQQSERYPSNDVTQRTRIHAASYQQQYNPKSRDFENLTDRQKFKELAEKQKYHDSPSPPSARHVMYRGDVEIVMEKPRKEYSPERVKTIQRQPKRQERYYQDANEYYDDENSNKIEYHPTHNEKLKSRYREMSPPRHGHAQYLDRNPYREPESLPYRESIEKMMKSPVMRYRSFQQEPFENIRNTPPQEHHHVKYKNPIVDRSPSPTFIRTMERERYHVEVIPPRYHDEPIVKYPTAKRPDKEKRVHIESISPESTMKKVSPKERFQDAKEKFQAMERIRLHEQKQSDGYRRSDPNRREMMDHHRSYSPTNHVGQNGWSSEDDLPARLQEYREMSHDKRYPGLDKFSNQQARIPRMAPAKSLGNITKGGYRHSYAEPLKYCSRVGLAAINPY